MSKTATVHCPHCQNPFDLDAALAHQARHALESEFAERLRQATEPLSRREAELAAREARAEAALQAALERERTRLATEAAAAARSAVAVDLSTAQRELATAQAELATARAHELQLRRERAQLDDERRALELDVQRRLDAERGRVREEALAVAQEQARLDLASKDRVIGELRENITRLQQRAENANQRIQGEVLEVDLAARLTAAFPGDTVTETVTGQRGADILQTARSGSGRACGIILWEVKRAAHWQAAWLPKLREDQRQRGAELAVLVSAALPAGVDRFGLVEQVWVCHPTVATALAAALREGLLRSAALQITQDGRREKAEVLYAWLTGSEFRQRVEGVIAAFTALREDLESEKRTANQRWARRERAIDQALHHTASLFGSTQGIVGLDTLPDLPALAAAE